MLTRDTILKFAKACDLSPCEVDAILSRMATAIIRNHDQANSFDDVYLEEVLGSRERVLSFMEMQETLSGASKEQP